MYDKELTLHILSQIDEAILKIKYCLSAAYRLFTFKLWFFKYNPQQLLLSVQLSTKAAKSGDNLRSCVFCQY